VCGESTVGGSVQQRFAGLPGDALVLDLFLKGFDSCFKAADFCLKLRLRC